MESNNDSSDKLKTYVVDESGLLVNVDLLNAEEKRKSRDEIIGTVPLPAPTHKRPKGFTNLTGKRNRIPGAFKKQLTSNKNSSQRGLVKCPLCKHKTEYNVLFVHIQVSHPQINPKILMAKFSKVYKNSNSEEKNKYEEELNELVNEYERLKQGQDESRDGGKYLGHMRRENGKFGSLPLYDDYSDDVGAE